jgi:signal peptidase II
LATSATYFLSLLSLAAIAGIYLFARSITSRAWGIALGFLLGGICGNLSDRIFRSPYWLKGAVTDWIKLPHWPVFNLADTSIVISAATIGLLLIKNVKPRAFDDAS